MHYFGPEMGRGHLPELQGSCGDKHPWECSLHFFTHNLDTKQFNYQPKARSRQMGFIQVKITLSECFGYQNCKQSGVTMPFQYTTECLQWWAFTPGKDIRCRTLDLKKGVGICPRVGLYPELNGTYNQLTNHSNIPLPHYHTHACTQYNTINLKKHTIGVVLSSLKYFD